VRRDRQTNRQTDRQTDREREREREYLDAESKGIYDFEHRWLSHFQLKFGSISNLTTEWDIFKRKPTLSTKYPTAKEATA
jgi:hypothetical protein